MFVTLMVGGIIFLFIKYFFNCERNHFIKLMIKFLLDLPNFGGIDQLIVVQTETSKILFEKGCCSPCMR